MFMKRHRARSLRRLLLSGLLGVLSGCGTSEADVREEIRKANTCATVADCEDVGSHCPYGCNVLVNRTHAEHIRQLLRRSSNNTCQYDCAQLLSIACEAGVCVGKYQ
jgi:hypothetical protein